MIETERLVLRPWRDSDHAPFAAMGRDPDVMRYFPALVSRQTSDEIVARVRAHFDREGWGLFAVEIKGGTSFVGFCGLQRVPFDAAFTPAVEVGWRLAREAWGHGYATEGARASLAHAFGTLRLPEVVSMVVPDNTRSIAVMHRLGMTRDAAADFDHPRFPEELLGVGGFPVRRHWLFRLAATLVVLALVACQQHEDNKAKPDPWLGSADANGPPSFADCHRRADEICPKVTAPFFYRVEKNGRVSYLLGTRHIGVALAKFPQVVRDRIHDAKLAVFEIDPADTFKTPKGGHDLPAEVGADAWKHYTEIVGPAVASTVAHERPAVALIGAAAMFEDAAFLEREIQADLVPLHTPMRGLETKRFQNELIDKLIDLRLFRAMVSQTKDRSEIERDSRRGLTRYCNGSDKATELSDEDRARMHAAGYTDADLDAYEDALIYSRNTSWIPALEPLFADGGAFVAVGAGHVRGDKGVVELLRARGWTVTRITE